MKTIRINRLLVAVMVLLILISTAPQWVMTAFAGDAENISIHFYANEAPETRGVMYDRTGAPVTEIATTIQADKPLSTTVIPSPSIDTAEDETPVFFIGWKTRAGGTLAVPGENSRTIAPGQVIEANELWAFTPSGDDDLYAQYKTAVTVLFDANGGYFDNDDSTTAVQYIVPGDKIKEQYQPLNDRGPVTLYFQGWTLNGYDSDPTTITVEEGSTYHFKAKWTNQHYTVTLDSRTPDGKNHFGYFLDENMNRSYTRTYTLAPGMPFSKDDLGFSLTLDNFSEWTYASGNPLPDTVTTNRQNAIASFVPDGNCTLVIKPERSMEDGGHYISLDPNPAQGGYWGSTGQDPRVVYVAPNSIFDPGIYTGSNRPYTNGDGTFKHWSSSSSSAALTDQPFTPAADQTLYALYSTWFTLNANGGKFQDDGTSRTIQPLSGYTVYAGIPLGEAYASDPSVRVRPPSQDQIFTGDWSLQQDGSSPFALKDYVPLYATEGMTLYAVFYPAECQITYDLAGGSLDGQTGSVTETISGGSTITLPEPTREGYVFDHWEGSRYDAGDSYKVTGDHTFTAVWTNQASIGGGSAGSPSSAQPAANDTGKAAVQSSSVRTGDSSNSIRWILTFIVAVIAAAAYFYIRKRR